jgi:pyridoxine/pyridoxamine 5'-phosphate oxidase
MTIATADGDGRPWATPVWFAHTGYREFIWVSYADARHSRNIAARSEVGIVIFDSTVAPNSGQAVYVEAAAEQLDGRAAEEAMAVFSQRSVEQGLGAWTIADVSAPGPLRPYHAVAAAHYVLGARDERIAAPF